MSGLGTVQRYQPVSAAETLRFEIREEMHDGRVHEFDQCVVVIVTLLQTSYPEARNGSWDHFLKIELLLGSIDRHWAKILVTGGYSVAVRYNDTA